MRGRYEACRRTRSEKPVAFLNYLTKQCAKHVAPKAEKNSDTIKKMISLFLSPFVQWTFSGRFSKHLRDYVMVSILKGQTFQIIR